MIDSATFHYLILHYRSWKIGSTGLHSYRHNYWFQSIIIYMQSEVVQREFYHMTYIGLYQDVPTDYRSDQLLDQRFQLHIFCRKPEMFYLGFLYHKLFTL